MTMIISGDNGLTFPNSTIQASAGSVLQVVNATTSTVTSTSSSTFVSTSLAATITPKFATSKILVIVDANGIHKSGATSVGLKLIRGATSILAFESLSCYTGTSADNAIGSSSINYLDSPATVSSTTYTIQIASQNNTGTAYINDTNNGTTISTITLMEIAG